MGIHKVRKYVTKTVLPVAAVLSVVLTSSGGHDVSEADFAGLEAREIADRMASDCRPSSYVGDADGQWDVVAEYAGRQDGMVRDYFSDEYVPKSDLVLLPVADLSWWGAEPAVGASADMHNVVPANFDVVSARGDYPPGSVEEASYDNGTWAAGIGRVDGLETNFYRPPSGFEGDFARIYMYMAVMYSQELWHGRATMLYVDGGFPLITRYGRETLMQWHRDDPVDDRERLRDMAIAARQGNSNPFVIIPVLAEYIWGGRSGEEFNPGEDDDPQATKTPLKAVYSRSSDGKIDFISPYVDGDSEWTFDGQAVDGQSMDLGGTSDGLHEVGYSNSRARGKVIILVEP